MAARVTKRDSSTQGRETGPDQPAGSAKEQAGPGKARPKQDGGRPGKSGVAATPRAPTPRTFERPRGGPARAIADLMPEVSRSAFRRFGFVQSSVVSRWSEIVGERHARVCAPEMIRFPPGEKSEGILEMLVEPGHAPLIQHVIPEIIERVNRFFGYNAVARVKLRQGAVVAREPTPRPLAPPSLKPIPMELGDSLRDIGDSELRAVLESLARSMSGKDQADKEEKER